MDLSLSINAIKNLFSFPFRDPNWKTKFLIGSGLSFAGLVIPILPGIMVWGYIARVIRAGVRNEDAHRLPEWDDWNSMLMDGLRQLGVVLIFTLPAILLMGAGWLFYMAGMASTFGIENDPNGAGGRTAFMLFSMLFFFITIGIGTLLSFAAWMVMPAAQAHVAIQQRFSAAFDQKGWWRILRMNFSGFLIGMGLFYVLNFLLMFIFQFLYMTLVLCIIAPLILFPASFYTLIIVYRIIGQAYGEGAAKDGVLPAAPTVETFVETPPAEAPAAI